MQTALFLSALLALPAAAQPSVEVLHWWTSGSEAKALQAVKGEFEKSGGRWVDVPIAGGGGDTARSVLKSRYVSNNPPGAAMMNMGPQVWEWGGQNALVDLDETARAGEWDKHLPKFIAELVKYKGKYVAVPLNVHRLNVLFANPAALRKAGVRIGKDWPKNFDEFNDAAEKLKKAGIIPLAHGGQPWQDEQLFDAVALGVGGPAFYQKALLELDPVTLGGPVMVKVFDQMRRLKGYTDKGSPGRDWNLATAMVMRGEAGMQLMGDWAKGEFTAAGKKPGVEFLCVPSPGTKGSFSVNNDSFAMFQAQGDDRVKGQKILAGLLMSENLQEKFNLAKGSIPARLGVPRAKFDACARQTMADFEAANAKGLAFSGFSGAVSLAVNGAIMDVVTSHFNSDMSSEEAAQRLAEAVKNAQ